VKGERTSAKMSSWFFLASLLAPVWFKNNDCGDASKKQTCPAKAKKEIMSSFEFHNTGLWRRQQSCLTCHYSASRVVAQAPLMAASNTFYHSSFLPSFLLTHSLNTISKSFFTLSRQS
jgi:hypothetical protein